MDYSTYSIDELMDCLNNIDKNSHPENYEKLVLEMEKRKPEIESLQKQEHEEFTFSTENRIKVLSWLQIATAVGFSIAFINVLLGSKEAIDLTIYGIIAIFNGFAGYRLLKRESYGYELSYINQILQILTINTGTLFFTYTGLGGLLIGVGSNYDLFFSGSLLNTDFRFITADNITSDITIGIDLLALFFLGVLHSCKELGLNEKANKPIKQD
jgi:hypothetical protein